MKKTFRVYHLLAVLDSYSFQGAPLDVHIGHYFKAHKALGSKDRAFVANKMYTMIRWLGLIDHHCKDSNSWEDRLEVLEKLKIEKCIKDPSIPIHIRASFPKILFTTLQNHYGEEKALQLCLESNKQAPITIRVNILKTNRQKLLSTWKDKYKITPTKHSVWGIQFEKRQNFSAFDTFNQGHFEVQDEASQLIANLLDPKPGQRVLDYCAGAGGKTLAIAHKLQGQGQMYLHDIRENALRNAKRRLKRAGIENAQIVQCDSPILSTLKGKMDWVLVDVPCSGSGTLRRNPDIKWKFSKEMLDRITQEQRDIFTKALSYLSPNGKIVYATCSILPEENEKQTQFFEENLELDLAEKPFRSYPVEGGMDGFYAAVLKHRR